MSDKSIQPADSKDSVGYLEETLQALIEALTGLAASEKKDWAFSIGYLLQRVRGGHFLKELLAEIKRYRDKGKIKPDYFRSEQSMSCLQEFMDFVDKDAPDDRRFQALKGLFLTIATEKFSNKEEILPLQLMKISRALSSSELILLAATYEIYLGDEWKKERDERKGRGNSIGPTRTWETLVLEKSGLKFRELVKLNEESLMSKKLLAGYAHPDGSGFNYTEYYRLTPLGYHLCLFISDYDASP
jgi:hypothetical protein